MKIIRLSIFYKKVLSKVSVNDEFKNHDSLSELTNYLNSLRVDLSDYFEYWLRLRYNIEASVYYVNIWKHFNVNDNKNAERGVSDLESTIDYLITEKPDIVFDQANILSRNSIELLKKKLPNSKIIIWDGYQYPKLDKVFGADLVLTCVRKIRDSYLKIGIKSEILPFAFESRLLDEIPLEKTAYDFSFIGTLSPGHLQRQEIIMSLLKEKLVNIWIANIGKEIASRSKLRELLRLNFNGLRDLFLLEKYNNGGVYGKDMYSIYRKSAATLNIHGDEVTEAGNMRLFEATGIGTCLFTDWKYNIEDYFKEDSEIVVYKNTSELLEKLKYLNNNELLKKQIAINGQKRVLKDHTYEIRTDLLMHYLENIFRK